MEWIENLIIPLDLGRVAQFGNPAPDFRIVFKGTPPPTLTCTLTRRLTLDIPPIFHPQFSVPKANPPLTRSQHPRAHSSSRADSRLSTPHTTSPPLPKPANHHPVATGGSARSPPLPVPAGHVSTFQQRSVSHVLDRIATRLEAPPRRGAVPLPHNPVLHPQLVKRGNSDIPVYTTLTLGRKAAPRIADPVDSIREPRLRPAISPPVHLTPHLPVNRGGATLSPTFF
ncbi:hypothetical protein PAPYR_964 [Paratrimastix pyriformis]|uniref:Uncharacterized protein n=1 Tax=Paratrimastix pyriformis TaxID=342808 RepID=A0ABQ8UY75_9EUKA|nr:hypothetical protein PAPYR_964 [Paratrimastix pyriformis]